MPILVTGGAGYIGSHMVHALIDRGEQVLVLDNLSTGIRQLVASKAEFIAGGVEDSDLVQRILHENRVSAVLHFAGSTVVPESVENPLLYYANNTAGTRGLIEACVRQGVRHFVFSSTAAVYGNPPENPVSEASGRNPISPYGRSKLMGEWILEDAARAHDLQYAILRYFNVAGADIHGRTGQSTSRATHLIKRACEAALGRSPHIDIFGTDYPTFDGTGVRDYIHVVDLVSAHLLALDHLQKGLPSQILNCGYGHGFSVREVIAMVEKVGGRTLAVRERPRRAGDLAALVADASLIRTVLNWRPAHDDLEGIVSTAYAWEQRLSERAW